MVTRADPGTAQEARVALATLAVEAGSIAAATQAAAAAPAPEVCQVTAASCSRMVVGLSLEAGLR